MLIKKYRPDIDGLRAVAVLLVLFFHAGLPIFPGGFVGVDVFFVISGFLITTIIHKGIVEGTFSFSGFYNRRIRRLMPALFSMMFVSAVLGFFLLLPKDLISFSKSAFFSAISLSNIFFWRENGGYFDGGVQEVPLLHTWSLSVEEQYYLFWPVYLIFCFKFFSKKVFVGLTALLFLCSLFLSEWVSQITFGASYYLLPTRMFELIAGSLLAVLWSDIPTLNRHKNDALSVVGLLLIILSAIYLNKADSFPGINALYVTIGTSILIYTGKKHVGIANKLLSLKPFVFIGLISYSLYLWHWPIIAYIHYIGIKINTLLSISIILLSIVLGWLSWKFIERPFRSHNKAKIEFKKTLTRLYILPTLVITCVASMNLFFEGWPQRYSDEIVIMDSAIASQPDELRGSCHSPSRFSQKPPQDDCMLGALDEANSFSFMFGDSHANHFTGFVDELAKDANIRVQDYTLDACLPLFDLEYGRNVYYANKCRLRNELARKHIENNKFKYVILSGEWPVESSFKYFYINNEKVLSKSELTQLVQQKLFSTLRVIINSGAIPVIIKDNAPGGFVNPKCSIIRAIYETDQVCEALRSEISMRIAFMNTIIDEALNRYPELLVIDPVLVMCDMDKCYSELQGIPLYRDRLHLNDIGSRLLGRKYLEAYGNPFQSK